MAHNWKVLKPNKRKKKRMKKRRALNTRERGLHTMTAGPPILVSVVIPSANSEGHPDRLEN